MRSCLRSLAIILFSNASFAAEDSGGPLNIYIDADYSVASHTAQAIEQGFTAALSTHEFQVAGHELQIVPVDHRANARRSIENIRRFDADEAGIAVIGGMHSPPYISHLEEINDRAVPLLLAWSAAGILTRHRLADENSIFRLSVDDTTVGPFLAREMLAENCARVGLVVIDNGWGRGNRDALVAALAEHNRPHVHESTMATEIGPARASHIVAELSAAQADCVGLVGIVSNSVPFMLALHEAGLDMRVFSHWGILGGGFTERVPHEVREHTALTVVQSCGLDASRHNGGQLDIALAAAQTMGWDYAELSDVPAPAGFVHGFDLGLIFMAALEQAAANPDWDAGIVVRRRLLRDALEALEQPVSGILRTYRAPFSPVVEDNMNGHEALSGSDLCRAQFDAQGRLVALVNAGPRDALAP